MSYGPMGIQFHGDDSFYRYIVDWWRHTSSGISISSGYAPEPDGTKPLPGPMLTHRQLENQEHITVRIYSKFKAKMQLEMWPVKRKPFLSIASVFTNPVIRCVSLEAPAVSGIPRAPIQPSRPDTRDWCKSGLIDVPLGLMWHDHKSTIASHYSANGCLEEALLVDGTTSTRHSIERQSVLWLPGHCCLC